MKTLLLLCAVIAIDIAINWWLIVKKKVKPDHPLNWAIRALVGTIIGYNQEVWLWLRNVISYVPIYWFVFDYGLNWARKKPLTYLGNAQIDQLEKKSFGENVWFFWKFLLMVFSILLILFNYNPYSAW